MWGSVFVLMPIAALGAGDGIAAGTPDWIARLRDAEFVHVRLHVVEEYRRGEGDDQRVLSFNELAQVEMGRDEAVMFSWTHHQHDAEQWCVEDGRFRTDRTAGHVLYWRGRDVLEQMYVPGENGYQTVTYDAIEEYADFLGRSSEAARAAFLEDPEGQFDRKYGRGVPTIRFRENDPCLTCSFYLSWLGETSTTLDLLEERLAMPGVTVREAVRDGRVCTVYSCALPGGTRTDEYYISDDTLVLWTTRIATEHPRTGEPIRSVRERGIEWTFLEGEPEHFGELREQLEEARKER